MRKKDREITDLNEILAVMDKCSVCRVALFDAEYPYIVPLNFGFQADGGRIALYFHCAGAGKKLDLLRRCNKVGFELDIPQRLIVGERPAIQQCCSRASAGTGRWRSSPTARSSRR